MFDQVSVGGTEEDLHGCLVIAAVLFALLAGVKVERKSIWSWVQQSGQRAMSPLEAQLAALTQGNLPDEEAMTATTKSLPLVLGADGVMAPFRPQAGSAKGKTVWREVKVGILVRLGQRLTKTGQQVTRLTQRRLVAVLGDIDELNPRLWLEAVRQGLLSSQRVVWLSDGGRGFWRLFETRFAQYATGYPGLLPRRSKFMERQQSLAGWPNPTRPRLV